MYTDTAGSLDGSFFWLAGTLKIPLSDSRPPGGPAEASCCSTFTNPVILSPARANANGPLRYPDVTSPPNGRLCGNARQREGNGEAWDIQRLLSRRYRLPQPVTRTGQHPASPVRTSPSDRTNAGGSHWGSQSILPEVPRAMWPEYTTRKAGRLRH